MAGNCKHRSTGGNTCPSIVSGRLRTVDVAIHASFSSVLLVDLSENGT